MKADERNHDDKIGDLTDDLLTVLDGHMDEIEMDELFYTSLKFMTITMCDCLENDQKSLRVLRRAMDDGIIDYMNKREI